MMVARYLKPMDKTVRAEKTLKRLKFNHGKHAGTASWTIIGLLALLYTVFSEIGILGDQGSFGKVISALALVAAICYGIHRVIKKQKMSKKSSVAENCHSIALNHRYRQSLTLPLLLTVIHY